MLPIEQYFPPHDLCSAHLLFLGPTFIKVLT